MIYKEIKEHLKNNELFSIDMLFDYIEKRCYEEDIEDFVSEIKVDSESECEYNPNTMNITINPNEILFDIKNKDSFNMINLMNDDERKLELTPDNNVVNIYNLYNINHEINHIKQNKIEEDYYDNSLLKALLLKDLTLSHIDQNYHDEYFYNKYHDYFFHEYNADIESYLETLYLLKSYDLDNIHTILELFNTLAASHILYCYSDINNKKKLSTPIENLLKLYKHLVKITDDDISYIDLSKYKESIKPKSPFERLRIGFSIDKDTIKYLEDIKKKKIKTLNLFDNIKR